MRSRAQHLLRILLTCQRGTKGCGGSVNVGTSPSGGYGQLTARGADAADVWPTHWAGSANRPPFIAPDQQSGGMSTDSHLAHGRRNGLFYSQNT